MPDFVYRSLLSYALLGALVGYKLFDWRARGAQAWARRMGMGLVTIAAGAAAAFGVAQMAPDYGRPVLLRSALGAWSAAWIVFGHAALWRNSWTIGRVVDRAFLLLLAALALGAGFVAYMVLGVESPAGVWAYLGTPLIAGALYRLLLVVRFLRLPDEKQLVMGASIDRALQGLPPLTPEAAATAAQDTVLFDPLAVRAAATGTAKRNLLRAALTLGRKSGPAGRGAAGDAIA